MEKGFTCECGKFHEFGGYVAAHWNESLIHTCDACEAKHSVRAGRVLRILGRKEKKARKKHGKSI